MPIKRYGIYFLFFAIISVPIFSHLDANPLMLWDESRLANSAIEMSHNNNWLIPMMDGQPDMWSTKPPFMIWMQVLAIRTIGTNELATRLPSALAALGTCLMIFFFFLKKYKEPIPGMISVLILVTTRGYMAIHGIRTGDYDSLLTMFMTGYVLFYFLYLDQNKRKYLYITFLFLIAAGLTKGVQSLIFLPALLLYAVYKRKLLWLLKKVDLYIGIVLVLVFVVGYYLLREHYNPGYIAAVRQNELGGRFSDVIEDHKGDIWYYYEAMVDKLYFNWYILIIPGIITGFLYKDKGIRDIFVFSLIVVFSYLLFISWAMTKLDWYLLPIYPFLAIIAGLFLYVLYRMLMNTTGWQKYLSYNALPGIFLFLTFIVPYRSTIASVEARSYDQGMEPWRIDLKVMLKDMLHHEHYMGKCQILNDNISQDLNWYYKAFRNENMRVSLVEFASIDPNGKLVVAKPRSKKVLDSLYNSRKIDSCGQAIVYELSGKKKLN